MATNAKNIAELLNTDTTVKVGDIEDGSVTTAKLAASAVTTAKVADDAVTSAKLFSDNLGRRNLIINGDMKIQQRYAAAAVTQAVNSTYSGPDRWRFFLNGGGAYTVTQDSGHQADTGHDKAIKIAVTTADTSIAAGDYYSFLQRIESNSLQHLQYGTSSAKSLTFSFWVRATKTGTHAVHFAKQGTGTDYRHIKEYTINASNTWEHKTITIPGLTASTMANDDSTYFQVGWMLKYGSDFQGTKDTWTTSGHYTTANAVNNMDSTSNVFYLTGVQLEVGDTATDFEHIPFVDQMLQCKRYCDITHLTASNTAGWSGDCTNAVNYHSQYKYSTRMRIAPTVTYNVWTHSGFPNTGGGAGGGVTAQRNGVEGCNYYSACNSTGDGRYYLGAIDAEAEL